MAGTQQVRTCPSCGAMNMGNVANCLRCGAPMAAPRPQPPQAPPPPAWQQPAAPPSYQPPAYQPAPPAWQQPPAYQQPPAAPYGYGYSQPQYGNNSGTGGPPPPEVSGWNWGAFFWTWLWGISHGVWISFVVFLLGFIWNIYLGLKGSELAWRSRRFDSIEQFKATQRAWAMWGWIFFFINLIGTVIAVFVIMAAVAAGTLDLDALGLDF